ncbi:MAG: metallophosphoesterase [Lachnospiraceae bacterium]|nr:metallophosphoesterase [Lachnospiraceae bacterium]
MGIRILLVIGILIVAFAVYQCVIQRFLQVVRVSISPPRAKNFDAVLPRKMIVFADLHNDSFGRDNEKLVAAIKAENPDIILIPGDLIIGREKDFDVAAKLLGKLDELGKPIYISLGNHESGTKEHHPELFERFMKESAGVNVHLLDNRTEYFAEHVAVSGFTLPFEVYGKRGRRHKVTQEEFAKITPAAQSDDFRILLAHTPYYFDAYAEYGADLVFAGHVHGGIVRLPWLGGVISPQMELFPKHDAGVYEKDGTTMVVTRGLGTHFPPIRIGNRPELLVITIDR